MAPIAVQTTSELTRSGIKHTIHETGLYPSSNETSTRMNDLDASKLIFSRNLKPKKVPEPDSPEVWAQNICTDHSRLSLPYLCSAS